METYLISLTSTGTLTQLPDSQKLFGALVYLFSDEYGKDKADKFVQDVRNKTLYLSLSNVLPEGYIPTPVDYLVDKLHDIYKNKELDFKKARSHIKQRNYISYSSLLDILKHPLNAEKTDQYVKITQRQQMRASIESARWDIAGLDSNLYSVPYLVPLEFNKEHPQGRVMTRFQFYLKADENALDSGICALIEKAVSSNRTIMLGKRASQGLNVFQFTEIEKCRIDSNSKNLFLNMGMLLPDQINYKESTLKLFTSERRPFEMTGGWDSGFQRQYISFIEEGSVISSSEPTKAGKSIQSPFDTDNIVFGNAFLYPMPAEGRCRA